MPAGLTYSLIAVLLAWLGYRQRDAIKPETREKLKRMWWHYCWGCFSTGMNGAGMALKASLGVAAGAALSPQTVQTPNPDTALYIFSVGFLLNALDWFTKNPLPTQLDKPNDISAQL